MQRGNPGLCQALEACSVDPGASQVVYAIEVHTSATSGFQLPADVSITLEGDDATMTKVCTWLHRRRCRP